MYMQHLQITHTKIVFKQTRPIAPDACDLQYKALVEQQHAGTSIFSKASGDFLMYDGDFLMFDSKRVCSLNQLYSRHDLS